MPAKIVLSRYEDAQEVYRRHEFQQAQYDEGDIIMADVLVNLHGVEHRDRRRVENQLFRRSVFEYYEREFFPGTVRDILEPCFSAGHAELVHAGHRMMVYIAARIAGIDLDYGDQGAVARLHDYLNLFIEALTLAQSTLDKSARKAAISEAMSGWTEEFYLPSKRRRERCAEEPGDLLGLLIRHQRALGLPEDVMRREIAFFMLVAAHTSATAFVRAVHHILEWLPAHPDGLGRIRSDPFFVQRCVHETIRLNPSSTVGMRRAIAPATLQSGNVIEGGSEVIIDLRAVNRDARIYGQNAADFDPDRAIPAGIPPYGLSFAAGMHVCIGQDLAAGVVRRSGQSDPGAHLFGLISVAVRGLMAAEVSLDPEDLPQRDPTTERVYWARYPVLLRRHPAGPGFS
jgi:cytochrome P450